MRNPPSRRKFRAFRPVNDALEARLPVSSLGLMAEVLPLTAFPTPGDGSVSRFDGGEDQGRDGTPRPRRDHLLSLSLSTTPELAAEPQARLVADRSTSTAPVADSTEPRQTAIRPLGSEPADPARPATPSIIAPPLATGPAGSGLVPQSTAPVVLSPATTGGGHSVPSRPAAAPGSIRPLTLDAPSVSPAVALAVGAGALGGATTEPGLTGGTQLAPFEEDTFSMMSGGSGGSGGSSTVNVIGGRHQVYFMSDRYYATVTSVEWRIDGAIYDQDYSVPEGTTIPLSNPYLQTGLNVPYGQSVNFSFYWNEEARDHTISYTVNYSDGVTSTSQPFTVDVREPIVHSFTNDYQELEFGPFSDGTNNFNGFHQGTFESDPGAEFSAVVSTTGLNVGGSFGFLQKINADWYVEAWGEDENGVEGYYDFTRNSGGVVLDNHPDGILIQDFSQSVYAGEQNVQVPAMAGAVVDSPWFGRGFNPAGKPWREFKFKNQFETHLMFQPSNGIWISLSKLEWENHGHVVRDLQGNWIFLPPLPGDPPSNPYPAAPGQATGDNVTRIVDDWTRHFGEHPAGGPLGVPWYPQLPF